MDSSCYSLMCLYKTEHNSFKYMKFSVYQFHIVTCQLSIHLILSVCIGVTYDETKAVANTDLQYRACQYANGQFCRINASFQPLTNPPSCVIALYAKNVQAIKEVFLVIFHIPCTFVPIAVTSNLWNIP